MDKKREVKIDRIIDKCVNCSHHQWKNDKPICGLAKRLTKDPIPEWCPKEDYHA